MKLDSTLTRIAKEVSEETGIPEDKIVTVVSYCMKFLQQIVQTDVMPKIFIKNLGTFLPNRNHINHQIERYASQPVPDYLTPAEQEHLTLYRAQEIIKLTKVRDRLDFLKERGRKKKKDKL